MQKVNWLVVGAISVVVILFLFGAGMMMGGWGYPGGGMMGGYGMTFAPGASAGMNNWGYSPFGWIGMFFMGLVSIGIVALIALGVIWLVRKTGNSTPPSS